jgi:hypothetical protein
LHFESSINDCTGLTCEIGTRFYDFGHPLHEFAGQFHEIGTQIYEIGLAFYEIAPVTCEIGTRIYEFWHQFYEIAASFKEFAVRLYESRTLSSVIAGHTLECAMLPTTHLSPSSVPADTFSPNGREGQVKETLFRKIAPRRFVRHTARG